MPRARPAAVRLEDRLTPAGFDQPLLYADLAPLGSGQPFDPRGTDGTVAVAGGDFNRDGATDLASLRRFGDVTIYLNDGAGRLPAKQLLSSQTEVGTFGGTLAAGDFDGDGKLDLAVASDFGGRGGLRVRVHPGAGDGTFGPGAVVDAANSGVFVLSAADLDRDGRDDLVALSVNGGVTVYGGRPGGLAVRASYPSLAASSQALADVDRDGRPDLLTVSKQSGRLTVQLGTAAGAFGPAADFPALAAAGSAALAAGDFTGDGLPDAAVFVSQSGGNELTLRLLPGRGDGTFGPPAETAGLPVAAGVVQPAVADLDADGKADIAFGRSVLLGNGAGGFRLRTVDGLASGQPPVVADFNRDGRPDAATGGGGTDKRGVVVALAGAVTSVSVGGRPDGLAQWVGLDPLVRAANFAAVRDATTGFSVGVPARVAAADLDGDGADDLVAGAGPGGRSTAAVFRTAASQQVALQAFEDTFTGGVFVAAGDLSGDGVPDLVVTPDRGGGPVVAVYDGAALGRGQVVELARFLGIEDASFRGGARAAVGDVDGDGRPELLVAAGFGGGPRLAVFDGRAPLTRVPGAVTPKRLVDDFYVFEQTLRNGVFLAAGDLTADGAAEVVVGGGPGGGPRVFALDGRLLAAGSQRPVVDLFAGDPNRRGGVRVAVRDNQLVTGSGENEPAAVRVYPAAAARANQAPTQTLSPFGGATLLDGVYVG